MRDEEFFISHLSSLISHPLSLISSILSILSILSKSRSSCPSWIRILLRIHPFADPLRPCMPRWWDEP